MSAPQVDIILPVYNAEETLNAALESLARQSFSDFRVIAVDDGSTDGSSAILDDWCSRDPRFVVIRQANAGIVSALNAGVQAATAPLIARMDGDDLSLPNRLARQVDYMAAHPDCVGLGCQVEHIDEYGQPITGLPQPGDPEAADPTWAPAREPYIIHPFLMARAGAVRCVGAYRHVPYSEDSDLFWRLRAEGRLHNLPEALGMYRFHTKSISGQSILNGRVMAIGSQLGALSARRRERNLQEPRFHKDLVANLRTAGSLTQMVDAVGSMVTPEERQHFHLATGVKLLELSAYRPYDLEASDCRFIGEAVRNPPGLDRQNALEVRWHVTEAAARMVRNGNIANAIALAPPRFWPLVMAKAARG